jgi:hypothetical protein
VVKARQEKSSVDRSGERVGREHRRDEGHAAHVRDVAPCQGSLRLGDEDDPVERRQRPAGERVQTEASRAAQDRERHIATGRRSVCGPVDDRDASAVPRTSRRRPWGAYRGDAARSRSSRSARAWRWCNEIRRLTSAAVARTNNMTRSMVIEFGVVRCLQERVTRCCPFTEARGHSRCQVRLRLQHITSNIFLVNARRNQ